MKGTPFPLENKTHTPQKPAPIMQDLADVVGQAMAVPPDRLAFVGREIGRDVTLASVGVHAGSVVYVLVAVE